MQAEQELKSLAQSKNVALPASGITSEIGKLEKDANFDQTYASMMVADHKKAIALFERASTSKDADVKMFADKTLPALREHLKLAQEAASMKTSTTDKTIGTQRCRYVRYCRDERACYGETRRSVITKSQIDCSAEVCGRHSPARTPACYCGSRNTKGFSGVAIGTRWWLRGGL